ncbi:putative cell wall glucanase [Protomyces lactucae-debilis]|uniref:Putative cell wall glucanase n=1 Tax=Protomyces lactucae-debilis TaxID=2754530 RepID=A0A1Y2FIC4_PROLT|nr:putative cell wall glucanase [Protomyces lactucae-debilis]ORY83689.1 putative cell wall glucanase [Protomyces lactucae-debilis]
MHPSFFTATLLVISSVWAQNTSLSSCLTSKCPASAPCCTPYGQCGTGSYCLGGCDPRLSFSIASCMPMPICKSQSYSFSSLARVDNGSGYLGDAGATDFTSSGPIQISDGVIQLRMPADSVGSVLTTTRYVWYGKVSATLQTSRGQGVVSAFITMSDVKDEIDTEWIGGDQKRGDVVLQEAQTNYYWQQVLNYTNGGIGKINGDASASMHTYAIDWQEDQITWSVDGSIVRVLKRTETYNATSKIFMFPQTPARIGLSIWPGGGPTQAPGTVEWAGGPIDQTSQEIQEQGFFAMSVKSLTVDCAPPPASAGIVQGKTSYRWRPDSTLFLARDIELTSDTTTLASFVATGLNRTAVPVLLATPSTISAPTFVNSSIAITGAAGIGNSPIQANIGTAGGDAQRGDGISGTQPSDSISTRVTNTASSQNGVGGFSQGSTTRSNGAAASVSRTIDDSLVLLLLVFVLL